jgi:hypothetical protein
MRTSIFAVSDRLLRMAVAPVLGAVWWLLAPDMGRCLEASAD